MMEKSGRKAAPPPEPTAVLRGHETAVNAVALCVPHLAAQQQPLLVSGDAGGAVCLWSLRTKRRLQVEPTAHSLTSGRRATAASGGEGEGEGGVQQVAFVAGGQQVLSQGRGYSSCVKLWATERLGTGSGSTATFPVATLAFCKLSVLERSSSSDDSVLFAVYGEEEGRRGEGEAVALWDLRTRAAVQRFPSPIGGLDSRTKTGMCMCLRLFNGGAVDDDGDSCQTYLASLWENGQLYLWDSRMPSAPFASTAAVAGPEAKRMHDEPPLAFDLAVVGNGCGVRGVSGGADTHIGIFSAGRPRGRDTSDMGDSISLEGTAEVLHQLRPADTAMEPVAVEQRLAVGHAGVGSVAIRGDQRIFATGGWDKRVRVWDFKRLRPLAILKAHAGPVNCVAFSNTDNLLVSGSADTRIACWSLY